MAHFIAVAFEENSDPLPSGDEPRPEDEAEDEETRSVPLPLMDAEAKPDSLWTEIVSAAMPLARTMPVKLSSEGVGEAAELTRTPFEW